MNKTTVVTSSDIYDGSRCREIGSIGVNRTDVVLCCIGDLSTDAVAILL